MKEPSLEQTATAALRACLEEIPFLQLDRIESSMPVPDGGADLQAWLRIGEQALLLLVQIKNNGQPRLARLAAFELKDRLSAAGRAYGIFIAPYISPASAKICEDAGIGYLDLAGNCLLSFGTIYIRKVGAPNPRLRMRTLRSLYSPRAERILRVLLDDPRHPWKLIELAQAAEVSIGQVANVKKLLLDREWASAPAGGLLLINPAALLDEWAQAYDFRRSTAQECYALAELPEIEARLAETCRRLGMRCALTGFSSAARLAPMVRYQKASAYVQGDIASLIAALGWSTVSSGANISLLVPYDQGVFYGAKEVGEIGFVSLAQSYLDLQSYRGRGQEAAQALRREMEKTW